MSQKKKLIHHREFMIVEFYGEMKRIQKRWKISSEGRGRGRREKRLTICDNLVDGSELYTNKHNPGFQDAKLWICTFSS